MALASKTTTAEYTIHQNPQVITGVMQVAGYDAITVTTTTQDLDVGYRQTVATSSAVSCLAKLPAGTFPGQQKALKFTLAASGHTLILTPASGVTWKQSNGSTDCASVTFDADNEYWYAEWDGAKWINKATSATVA